ncbi:Crp/Fnr family transcriptional regulator [Sideroxydans lithotrophicus]|uniref:Putative transcriptional regulator, Crp/Fnr family n=1 Tax=Sideroxydans lithotrophicus (strain ES-1) TaxID=580332 RepID=D5CM92_SIDLE|nr:cyclic nucleotide-binding domain-containing protein [Sideroxydans lithotrophicus]ADE10706.1 putative transcriptional regulator, Crp/Fnr family [Sideroxydans lithotrophicus ES-1]
MSDHSAFLEEISSMLLDCDLFSHLSPAELHAAAHYFGVNKIAEDEIIFNEGDAGTFMCIVHSGNIAVFKANLNEEQVEVTRLGHGRALGEMAVLDGERRSATCQASEDSILLTLSKEALDKMLEEHPRIGARVIRAIAVSLSRRLRMAVGQLVDHII